jgi:hypothetical protein
VAELDEAFEDRRPLADLGPGGFGVGGVAMRTWPLPS